MKFQTETRRRLQRGQTLFMALIILGILLVLGLVFAAVVNRNILQSGTSRNRSIANDLAEAGVRYAHNQLVNSAQGADWRGEIIDLAPVGIDTTRDPDMLYLRPGTGFGFRDDADSVIDKGGPDGLGPFTRVNFARGRALIRVRYAPSDNNVFQTSAVGQLRSPGAARNYLIVESIGRNGVVNPNDPTTQLQSNPIQFRNYANSTAFRTSFGEMKEGDRKFINLRRLIAFASVGITETARYITNVDRVSRPAEFGSPNLLGVQYEGQPVSVPMVLGSRVPLFNLGNPPTPTVTPIPNGGSLYANADIVVHGTVDAFLNATLGDSWLVSGTIRGADTQNGLGTIRVTEARWQTPNWNVPALPAILTNISNPSLDSRNNNFSTGNGLIRDGLDGTDQAGFWRNVPRKDPPLMNQVDPQTNINRFHASTRESGPLGPNGNTGRFGHGSGVYVDNLSDRQMDADEAGRELEGSERSLVYDWFNPGNRQQNSGWKGQYYIPRGAQLRLTSDGFVITRDPSSDQRERTWRRPDGTNTASSTIRYRIGDVGGVPYIVNTYTPGVNINQANPGFNLGRPFNGVLMFEGNVRVRGVIPTDRQLTVASNATIYVEGSITKGVVDANGNRLNRPSRSMIALLAKDYVAVNTTMFFGPLNTQNLDTKEDAVYVHSGGNSLDLQADLLLDPETSGGFPNNPGSWAPYAIGGTGGYVSADANQPLSSNVLIRHTMEDGAGNAAVVSMDVNAGLAGNNSTYLFPLAEPNSVFGVGPYIAGYVTPGFAFANFVPLYGLGTFSWQRYAKYESTAFPLIQPTSNVVFPAIASTGGEGLYNLIVQESNSLTIRDNAIQGLSPNDYLLSRLTMFPHDIRIEATMYAQEGSFVVIPGYWFNENPNDRRDVFEARVQQYLGSGAFDNEPDAIRAAWIDRQRDYGSSPATPFFSEPVDVRVQIVGSISENMPLPMSYQADWMKKWGWIPRQLGALYRFSGMAASRVLIPTKHVPAGYDISDTGPNRWVPNFSLSYDPALGTGREFGFGDTPANPYLRTDQYGRPLLPLPRLPVSPTLAYFGEVLQ